VGTGFLTSPYLKGHLLKPDNFFTAMLHKWEL